MTDPATNPESGPGVVPAATTSTTTPSASVQGRPRYQRKERTFWQRIPVSLWILAPFAIASVGWFAYRDWQRSRTVVTFARTDGEKVPQVELELFDDTMSFAMPSPPSPYAKRVLEAGEGSIVFGPEDLPGSALLRYSGQGIGIGYATISRGEQIEVRLAAPAATEGRVGKVSGMYAMGLRTLGMEPVAGARVVAMGGGERGIALCETVTDAEGRFRLEGFSSDLPMLGIRVLAKDCALAFSNQFLEPGVSFVVPMLATRPLRGRVELPEGKSAAGLRVLAKGLPGVEAKVAGDGAFELDHVPPNLEPRLLVHGLPNGLTHAQVNAHAGQEGVAIVVQPEVTFRGRVVERMRQAPMGGAMVWHDCGPGGGVTVQADGDGRFSIHGAPPGELVLRAQCSIKNDEGDTDTLSGERKIVLEVGKDPGEVMVRID